jgi:hypothetical protein
MIDTKPLIEARTLLEVAKRNYGVLQAQLKDLTHEDSLLQLPFRGNCLNWIIGHITQSRDRMLQLVDEPSVWTIEQIARYQRDSPPVTSGEDAIRLEQMLADLATMHGRLTARLERITPEELAAPGKEVIKGIATWSVGEFVNFLLWHETYHVGQTEILRQLAGKNDKVI